MDISIIIVSYNTCDLLRNCLASVREKTHGLSCEIIVVDNASSDGSCEMVEREYPEVRLMRNHKNLGFARANNQAIKESESAYVLLLNSDTVIENNVPAILYDFMQEHPRAAVCGPLLLNADKSIQRSIEAYPTVLSMTLRLTLGLPLNRAPGPLRDKYHTDFFSYSERCSLSDGWLTGAALMIRRAVFFETGLFDEQYHVYNEDTDWGLAVSRSGWETWFVPEASVTHLLGASSRTGLTEAEISLKLNCLRQNRYYVRKNLGKTSYNMFRFAVFCCASANLLRRLFRAAVSSPENHASDVFKKQLAWRLFLASIEPEGKKTIEEQ